jgi:hypothetical protein
MAYRKINGKTIIGLVEPITLVTGDGGKKTFRAKVDTGASKSSMEISLQKRLGLGPVIKKKLIKSAHGSKMRPVIEAEAVFAGKTLKAQFTLADRKHLSCQILVGQNMLKYGFLIDPRKK